MDHLYADPSRPRLQTLWELLISPAALEADSTFRDTLLELMYAGLRWGGGTLCGGALLHVLIEVLGRGKSIVWLYAEPGGHEIAVMYHAVTSVIGGGLIAIPLLRGSLRMGRLAVAATLLTACSFSIHDDLLRGASVSIAFVVMLYLMILVLVPFRPWQTLGVGLATLGVYVAFAGEGLLLAEGATAHVQFARKASELSVAILLGTALSTALYATRLTHHRIRRAAERELEAARDEAEEERGRAEEALVTVREQAGQLRELEQQRSRFFAKVSHELRTPLSLMLDPIRQMLGGTERPAGEADRLRMVYQNAQRLQRLIEQLLDLARFDAGRLELRLRRRAWGPFVEGVMRRLAPLADKERVDLTVDTAGADATVAFDPDRMETVASNLVRNALTYTPAGGKVHVQARIDGVTVGMTVADNGPGIPEAEQAALFDRFYQGTVESEHDGTGIGLALTKVLMEAHDGTIAVDSTPGEGSTFEVRWPADVEAPVPEDEEGMQAAAVREADDVLGAMDPDPDVRPDTASFPTNDDRTTVLVVEDNASVRAYVRELLEPHYQVVEAEHGADGLSRARATLPDLVVADVMMPALDGFEMLRALRRSERTTDIPVVMLTARVEPDDQVEGWREGVDAYVTKPFDGDVLVATVDRLIAARRQLRERHRADEAEPGRDTPAGSDAPLSFEERVRAVVREHLADADFTVEQLASEVGLARRTVTKKTKETIGQTPSALIRSMRLERGAELLVEDAGTISEVAYAVGFNSLSYFSRRFKSYFGVSPSAYRKEKL